jgi:hypothetical protein
VQRELGWLVDDAVENYSIDGATLHWRWREMQRRLELQPTGASCRVARMRIPLDRLEFAWRQRVVVRLRNVVIACFACDFA